MPLAEQLRAEARHARLIASNLRDERFRDMLLHLAERLEREAGGLRDGATPPAADRGLSSRLDARP